MIKLIPITQEDYEVYLNNAIKGYAEDKVKSGNWHESEALKLAEKEYTTLLPEGPNTKDNYIFSIVDSETNQKVGIIWLNIRKKGPTNESFIFDFLIFEQYRKKGYGEQAMLKIEEVAKANEAIKISLHVFGFNKRAIALYNKVGYEVTNMNMSKKLN